MSKLGNLGARLHRGEVSYDFIGKRKLVVHRLARPDRAVARSGSLVRGLTLGIEFKGGVEYFIANVKVTDSTVSDFRDAVRRPTSRALRSRSSRPSATSRSGYRPSRWTRTTSTKVRTAIAEQAGVASDTVNYSQIGASWGGQIANKAITRAARVHRAGVLRHLALLPRAEGVDGRAHRAGARRADHRRRLCADRFRRHAGDRDRRTDDPRLLAVRHGRGVRQDPGEHPRHHRVEPATPTATRPTWPSTRPSSGRSTPR